MSFNVVVTGMGGQGCVSLGKAIAMAAAAAGWQVAGSEKRGGAQRGGAAEVMLRLTHASGIAHFVTMLVIALFLGSEAGSLRRWTLSRRKWQQIGLVAADNEEAAERRFFEQASQDGFAYPAKTSSAVPMPRSSIVAQDAAGFFPMPDGSR